MVFLNEKQPLWKESQLKACQNTELRSEADILAGEERGADVPSNQFGPFQC